VNGWTGCSGLGNRGNHHHGGNPSSVAAARTQRLSIRSPPLGEPTAYPATGGVQTADLGLLAAGGGVGAGRY